MMGCLMNVSLLLWIATALAEAPAPQDTAPSTLACVNTSSLDELDKAINEGNYAFLIMDSAAMRVAGDRAHELLPCLSEPLNEELAASFHVHEALAAFVAKNEPGVVQSFRSVIEIDPRFRLPESVAPIRHPLRIFFERASIAAPAERVPIPAPHRGRILIDGREQLSVPTSRPFFYQWVDQDGGMLRSIRVLPGEPIPSTGALVEPTSSPLPPEQPSSRSPLYIGLAAGAAVIGAGTYTYASFRARQFSDPGTPCADMPALRSEVNSLVVTSAALEGLALFALGVSLSD